MFGKRSVSEPAFGKPAQPAREAASAPPRVAAEQSQAVMADALWLKWSDERMQNDFQRRLSLLDAWWQAWGYDPAQDLDGMSMS